MSYEARDSEMGAKAEAVTATTASRSGAGDPIIPRLDTIDYLVADNDELSSRLCRFLELGVVRGLCAFVSPRVVNW